jgi:uncharacterized membrane protein YgaE (UPF0421/DUF939 family)
MSATTARGADNQSLSIRRGALGARLAAAREALVAGDPGLIKLFGSLEIAGSIAITIAAVYGFMQLTHLMWIEPPAGAHLSHHALLQLDAQHHGITVVAMILGGVIATLSAMTVGEPTGLGQALTLAILPIPFIGTVALAAEMVPHRALGIVVFSLVMGVGSYMRKWLGSLGTRMFAFSTAMFTGYLIGFVSNGAIPEHEIGSIAILIGLSCAINLMIKIALRPVAHRRLDRVAASFRARCRAVVRAAIALFDATDPLDQERCRQRLHLALASANESAIILDGTLTGQNATPAFAAADDAHHELIELELLVQEVGRTADALASAPLPASVRAEMQGWLAKLSFDHVDVPSAQGVESIRQQDFDGLLDAHTTADAHRFARTITATVTAAHAWPRHHGGDAASGSGRSDEGDFSSPVMLAFGDLPGSTIVSFFAFPTFPIMDRGWLRHLPLPRGLFSQGAVRMALAVGIAAAIGSAISEQRFYWAVIGVFVVYMGTNTAGEQLVKGIDRIVGTAVGIVVGALLAHAVGVSTWSILLVIVALSSGMYFARTNYWIAVIGVTIAVAQMYQQLGQFSNDTLLLRLAEMSVGATVATICSLVIFPIPTVHATKVALRRYFEALSDLLTRAQAQLLTAGEDANPRLTTASRNLDFAAQQFLFTTRPLRYARYRPFLADDLEQNNVLISQTAHYARRVAVAVQRHQTLEPVGPEVANVLVRARDAVDGLTASLSGSQQYARHLSASSELDELQQSLDDAQLPTDSPPRRLLVTLDLLDEAIAELHQNLAEGA